MPACFPPRHASFWSQLNAGLILLSPNCWAPCGGVATLSVLFAAELIQLPAEQPVWHLLTWPFVGLVSVITAALGSSHPRSLYAFLSLIGRLWRGGGERESEREQGIMGWDITHAGDKLNLSLATSQLIENPSEIFKKMKKLIVNTLEYSFRILGFWMSKLHLFK